MQNNLPWIIAIGSGFGLLILALIWSLRRPERQHGKPLPTDWSLTARPVFSADERRVYRLLKEALPHHVVLSKLPLVRFCQPTETNEVRYWFDLLGAIHVSFAICSPNGRVLAAIDLDSERGVSGRSLQIKQSVLGACRVRYLRCPVDNLPTTAELQLLVPFSNSQSRGPQAAPAAGAGGLAAARRRPSINSKTPRRAGGPAPTGRASLWQDSAVFQDSFFAPDSRFETSLGPQDVAAPSDDWSSPHGSRAPMARGGHPFAEAMGVDAQYPDEEVMSDIVGVVIDSPRYADIMGGRRQR